MLEGLVSAVLREEEMRGSDQYSCDVCGCKQDAVKQCLIEELPEILLITLLRFDHTPRKVCRFVEIPPSLSLTPRAPEEQAAVQYKLFGVVTHEGSTLSQATTTPLCINSTQHTGFVVMTPKSMSRLVSEQ